MLRVSLSSFGWIWGGWCERDVRCFRFLAFGEKTITGAVTWSFAGA